MTPEDNPFSRFYREPGILDAFYRHYRPRDLEDALRLVEDRPRTEPSVPLWKDHVRYIKDVPWTGKYGLSASHGCNLSGPVSQELIMLERIRLSYVLRSLNRRGLCPERYSGHLRGMFVVHGDEYVVRITGGLHRAAALAYLGFETLPVMFHPYEPRGIDSKTCPHSDLLAWYFDESLLARRRQFLDALAAQAAA